MQAPFIKPFTALCVLLATSCASTALTLGSLQGSALLGRPLDVRVAAQFNVQEDPQASCMTAEVMYNETRLDAGKVSTQTIAAGSGEKGSYLIRIKTAVAVDEPVVSIQLRAGCQDATSRQYLLLAENSAAPALKTSDARRTAPATTKTRPRSIERLTLTPIDLAVDYVPALRATSEMLAVPPEDAQRRAEAAMWWKTLNASPEWLMQQEQRLQRVQEQRRDLDTVNATIKQGLAKLADKTRQAEDERYANGLVYSLLGMLLVTVLAMLWAWRSLRKAPDPNWAGSLQGPDSLVEGAKPVATPTQRAPHPAPAPAQNASVLQTSAPHGSPVKSAAKVALDVNLDQIGAGIAPSRPGPSAPQPRTVTPVSGKVQSATVGLGAHRPSGFANSGFSMDRAIESEEVLNAREQAAFFVALGQSNRAIEVLTNRIAQIGESSPLVGLDLLNIYHAEGRRDDFEFMRQEFMRWFAVHIPPFEGFKNGGQSLENYPQIMQEIVALWPTPPVLEYIEACVYQHAGEDGGKVFDLQAYLDLLLLYGTAKRMVRHASDEQDATSASELLRFRPRTPDSGARQVTDDTASPRMRTPIQDPTDTPVDEAAKHKGITDFGFLHLH